MSKKKQKKNVQLDAQKAEWLRRYRNKRTSAGYEHVVDAFHLWLRERHIPWLEVTRDHVQAYSDHLEAEGKAAGTRYGVLSTLTTFYEHLIEFDVYVKNPAKNVPRPVVSSESTRQAPSLEQCMAMNDLAAVGPDPREHLLFCLLFFNALRVEEALSLTLGALQHKNGRTVFQLIGKGSKPANVTLPAEPTVRVLEKVRSEMPDPNARVLPWTRHQANRIIQDLAQRAEIHDVHVTPHSLRHASITVGFERGMPTHEVQAMARHSNPQTTWRYFRGKDVASAHVTDGIASIATNPYGRTA